MPEFHMEGKHESAYQELDAFTQAYIESIFFTDNAPDVTTDEWQATEDHAEGSIPGDVGFTDLAPKTLARIVADCKAFQEQNAKGLEHAYTCSADGLAYTPDRAGHDFWLTRNGHGAGFWCRDFKNEEGEPDSIGDELSELCGHGTQWSGLDSYLGDDGKVYL